MSKSIILAQVELVLKYAERFYKRQFITRDKINNSVLTKTETLLLEYFNRGLSLEKGLPTVEYIANELHLSPNYLSNLLKQTTGRSTQVHIHEKLIEKAKEKLSGSFLTVNEITELGFERPESFSRFFKDKTSIAPLRFRKRFKN